MRRNFYKTDMILHSRTLRFLWENINISTLHKRHVCHFYCMLQLKIRYCPLQRIKLDWGGLFCGSYEKPAQNKTELKKKKKNQQQYCIHTCCFRYYDCMFPSLMSDSYFWYSANNAFYVAELHLKTCSSDSS